MEISEVELLDFIDTPIFALEPDDSGRPVFVAFNEAASRIVAFDTEQALGKTAEEVYAGELGGVIYQRHVSVFQTGEQKTFELAFPIDGRIRHIRTHLKPVLAADNLVRRIIGTVKDVSAEHELSGERSRNIVINHELEAFHQSGRP